MSYAVPQVDWSPLGNLLNTYQDARRKAERERILRDAGQSQELNLSQLGQRLLGTGDLEAGVSLYRLGQQQRQLDAQTRANEGFLRTLSGGAAPAQPATTAPAAPPSTQPTPTQAQFVEQMMPHAQRVAAATGLDPRLIIAQAAQETGWGRSAPGNNFFGIKSHGQPGGNTFATTEVVNGQPVRQNASFRAYGDMGQSADDYGRFLQQNPRYRGLLGAQGLDAQLAALGASGYATDPNYAASVGRIARGIHIPGAAAIPPPAAGGPVQVASAPPGTATDAPAVTGALPPAAASSVATPAPVAAQSAPQARVTTGQPVAMAAGPLDHLSVQQLMVAGANPSLSEGMRQMAQTLLKSKLEASNLTPDQRNYVMARGQGETRSFSDWMVAMKQAGATRVNQNNTQQAESIEQKERLQGLSGQLNEIAKQGGQVAQRSADLDMAGRILSRMQTGPGTDLRATLDGIGRQLGLSSGALKTQADAVTAIVQRIAPTLRQPGSGAQSDAELRGFLASLPSITALPEGNQLILGTLRRAAEIDRERLKIATDWQSNRITATVAADRLAAINQRSIFASDAERELVANIMGGQPLSGAPQPEGQNNNWRVIGVQ